MLFDVLSIEIGCNGVCYKTKTNGTKTWLRRLTPFNQKMVYSLNPRTHIGLADWKMDNTTIDLLSNINLTNSLVKKLTVKSSKAMRFIYEFKFELQISMQ